MRCCVNTCTPTHHLTYSSPTYHLLITSSPHPLLTGMFVPSLAVGATGGRIVGRLVKAIVTKFWPNVVISLTSYSIIGAAAFLGGSTRMTLTTTVMVMETTGALQLIVPIMLTVAFAKFVGDQWGLGIDDTHIKLRGAPYLVCDCCVCLFVCVCVFCGEWGVTWVHMLSTYAYIHIRPMYNSTYCVDSDTHPMYTYPMYLHTHTHTQSHTPCTHKQTTG